MFRWLKAWAQDFFAQPEPEPFDQVAANLRWLRRRMPKILKWAEVNDKAFLHELSSSPFKMERLAILNRYTGLSIPHTAMIRDADRDFMPTLLAKSDMQRRMRL